MSERSRDSIHDRRRGYGRALRVGLAASVVFHVILLLVIGRSLRIDARDASPAADAPVEVVLQGPRAVTIGEILPEPDTPEDEQSEEQQQTERALPPPERADEPPAEPTPRGPPAGDAETEADPEDGYLTNAERLQPKEGDERLYADVPDEELPVYLAENPFAAYEGEIRARLGMMLDSLALSEEQRRRATEWITGEEGSEWGVSEDGLYIDGMLIPLDLRSLFQEEGPRGRERRQEMRDLQDIRYQDLLQDAEDIRDERAREMRERTREELEQRMRDSLEAAQDSAEDEEPGGG